MKKIHPFLGIAIAAFSMAACHPKDENVTRITGVFETEAPEQVGIFVPDADFNSSVPVKDGKFTAKIPVGKLCLSYVQAGKTVSRFISDGTSLTLTFFDKGIVSFRSNAPKVSLQVKYDALKQGVNDLKDKYKPEIDAFDPSDPDYPSSMDKVYARYKAEYDAFNLEFLSENRDNVIGAIALDNLRYTRTDAEMESLIGRLDPSVQALQSVEAIKQGIRKNKDAATGRPAE